MKKPRKNSSLGMPLGERLSFYFNNRKKLNKIKLYFKQCSACLRNLHGYEPSKDHHQIKPLVRFFDKYVEALTFSSCIFEKSEFSYSVYSLDTFVKHNHLPNKSTLSNYAVTLPVSNKLKSENEIIISDAAHLLELINKIKLEFRHELWRKDHRR